MTAIPIARIPFVNSNNPTVFQISEYLHEKKNVYITIKNKVPTKLTTKPNKRLIIQANSLSEFKSQAHVIAFSAHHPKSHQTNKKRT
ncbi:hypothetical protein IKO18_02875 [bacterium]|jgi:hypothetical protein|nr:hypothetical protein [bacterium]